MATSLLSYTSDCCICCERYITPKILPCGHTFCLECIKRLISDNTETFPCPTCKRDVTIPEGGAKDFITNFQLTPKHTTQVRDKPPSTIQPKCPNHNQKGVDYYCNNCNVGLCFKCIHVFKQHRDHETLDIECDETRNNAIGELNSSQKIIQNRIKNLERTRSTLLESFQQLRSLCEDSCAEVTKKTDKVVSDLRKSCKQIIQDIRKKLEENRSKVEDRVMEITSDINLFESNMDSFVSLSTETTLDILLTLPRLKEIEKLGESRTDYNLCLQYIQWMGKDFSLDIDQLGSVISKSYIPGSFQFIFDVSDIEEDRTEYYSKNKFRNHNLVWSCRVVRTSELCTVIRLLPDDNPELDYCVIDGQISLLNFDDESKSKTRTVSEKRIDLGGVLCSKRITWSKLTDEDNGYLRSNGQFVVQFDITQIREIES